jgi:hypothetical protein
VRGGEEVAAGRGTSAAEDPDADTAASEVTVDDSLGAASAASEDGAGHTCAACGTSSTRPASIDATRSAAVTVCGASASAAILDSSAVVGRDRALRRVDGLESGPTGGGSACGGSAGGDSAGGGSVSVMGAGETTRRSRLVGAAVNGASTTGSTAAVASVIAGRKSSVHAAPSHHRRRSARDAPVYQPGGGLP